VIRKIFLILSPLLILSGIFFILLFVANRNSGKGALQVTSLPGSKVYLDGNLIGQTPICLCQLSQMLKTGEFTIRLDPQKQGLDPFEQKIQIYPNVLTAVDRSFDSGGQSQGSIVSLKSLPDNKSIELLIVSFPNKAQVFLDESPVGTTPLSLKNITASDHDIKLSKDGYADKIVKVKTVLGYTLEATVFMGVNVNLLEQAPTSTSSVKLKIQDTPVGFLLVREEASFSSKEIGQVKPGEEYEILEETDGWFKIKLLSGQEGWISSGYAKKE
jgi:hypothetical protein